MTSNSLLQSPLWLCSRQNKNDGNECPSLTSYVPFVRNSCQEEKEYAKKLNYRDIDKQKVTKDKIWLNSCSTDFNGISNTK